MIRKQLPLGKLSWLVSQEASRILLVSSAEWSSLQVQDSKMLQKLLQKHISADMACDLAQVAHAEDRRNFSGGSEDSHPAGKSNKRYVSTGLFKDF